MEKTVVTTLGPSCIPNIPLFQGGGPPKIFSISFICSFSGRPFFFAEQELSNVWTCFTGNGVVRVWGLSLLSLGISWGNFVKEAHEGNNWGSS